MAWMRTRTRKDGGTTYYVQWREPGSDKIESLSIKDDRAAAQNTVRLLDANGQSFSAAKRANDNAKIDGPTVKQNLLKHIALNTSAGPDQIQRYDRAVKNHFSGVLGKTPLKALAADDVRMWVKYMQGKGLSAKTIANWHGLLSSSLETAVQRDEIDKNPCRAVRLPKDDRTEEIMRVMSVQESQAIISALPERYQVFVAFLRATGCRFGEATALHPTDFTLDGATPSVRIERAWKRNGDGSFYIGPPKTKKSRRTISLPPSLVEMLRYPVAETASMGWVFHTTYGGHIRHSTFHDYWKGALDSLAYDAKARPRIHDMRHTHASLMLAAGMPIYELSRRLGHESIQTTIDRYSHLVPDAHFRAMDIAEKALTA